MIHNLFLWDFMKWRWLMKLVFFLSFSLQRLFLLYWEIFDRLLGTTSFLQHLCFFRHLLMIHVDHSLKMWFLFKETLLCWEQSWDHLLFLMFLVLIFHLKYNHQHKDLLTLFDWFVVNRLVKVQLFLLNHAQPGYH